jgi:hypothetical protein
MMIGDERYSFDEHGNRQPWSPQPRVGFLAPDVDVTGIRYPLTLRVAKVLEMLERRGELRQEIVHMGGSGCDVRQALTLGSDKPFDIGDMGL